MGYRLQEIVMVIRVGVIQCERVRLPNSWLSSFYADYPASSSEAVNYGNTRSHRMESYLLKAGVCERAEVRTTNCGSSTQKESPVLFRGRSLVEQRNFYIPFLGSVSTTRPKYFRCPVLFAAYRVMRGAGTGKTPYKGMTAYKRFHQSVTALHSFTVQ